MVKLVKAPPADALASEPATEPATSFQDLIAEAGAIDSAAPPGAPGAALATVAPDPAVTMAADLFALLKMPRNLVAKRFAWWPEFGVVWSDDQLRAIAQAFADLCVHMGWDIDEAMGKFGPWVAIVVTVGVPSYVTWDAVQDRRAQLAHQAAQAKKQATSAQHGDPQ